MKDDTANAGIALDDTMKDGTIKADTMKVRTGEGTRSEEKDQRSIFFRGLHLACGSPEMDSKSARTGC